MFPAAKNTCIPEWSALPRPVQLALWVLIPIFYLSAELILCPFLQPYSLRPILTAVPVSLLLNGICISLPRQAGRVFFAVSGLTVWIWAICQAVYFNVFGKVMWLTDTLYGSDGAVYFDTILRRYFSPAVLAIFLSCVAVLLLMLVFWPVQKGAHRPKMGLALVCLSLAVLLTAQPARSRETPRTMDIYRSDGYYALSLYDLRNNILLPLMPENTALRGEDLALIDAWFQDRPQHTPNDMTGIFAGRDLVIVLMEAVDDWMITPEEMPTVCALQEQSIRFTRFYTPYYGTTRSINTQTCIDLSLYFPTDGRYFYDYLGNCFDHSLANRFKAEGYSVELFHHNWPDFYRRTELVPALGYDSYNSYVIDAGGDEWAAMNDCHLFDSPAMRDTFFREGPTVNFVATQSAHLPYDYSDLLSQYAFRQHPEAYGKYDDEQEDCIRAKSRLVDDLFARLLEELEAEGRLDNTVILALSDHYPYGYQDQEQLLRFADGAQDVLELEKTPCFLWAADLPPMQFDKTTNTADILPTLLNLFGISSPYPYLGRDVFDPAYTGFAFFEDGSWAAEDTLCRCTRINGRLHSTLIIGGELLTQEQLEGQAQQVQNYIRISNKLLSADYYRG